MEPGQLALQGAAWLASPRGGLEAQAILGVEVPVSHTVAAVAWGGVLRRPEGTVEARDATLAALWLPVSRDDLTIRLQPGLSIPTGGLGGGLGFNPLSTASIDPWFAGDLLVGTSWMGGLSVVTRVPLYEGWDGVRQGPFVRGDVRLARRFAKTVAFVGVSGVRQAPGTPARGADFAEAAVTAGAVVAWGQRWSLTPQLRVPLWASTETARQVSGGLGVRAVVGSPPADHHH